MRRSQAEQRGEPGHDTGTGELTFGVSHGVCGPLSLTRRGASQNQFDCIDLSDNELVKLEGFPPLKRLSTLLAHNNRITRLSPALGGAYPLPSDWYSTLESDPLSNCSRVAEARDPGPG